MSLGIGLGLNIEAQRKGGTASFTGLGNVVSGAVAYWGLRGYNAAFATGTNAALTLRRSSDSTTTNIVILANGNLDVATAQAFIGGGSGFVTALFDQTGNGHHLTQATAANQPQLVFNSPGSHPSMVFNGTTSTLANAASPTQAQPFTFAVAANNIGGVGGVAYISNDDVGNGHTLCSFDDGGTNLTGIFAGDVGLAGVACSDGTWHRLVYLFNGVSGSVTVNGSTTTGSGGPQGLVNTSPIALGTDSAGGQPVLSGNIAEIGLWPIGFSAGQIASVDSNISSYWGI